MKNMKKNPLNPFTHPNHFHPGTSATELHPARTSNNQPPLDDEDTSHVNAMQALGDLNGNYGIGAAGSTAQDSYGHGADRVENWTNGKASSEEKEGTEVSGKACPEAFIADGNGNSGIRAAGAAAQDVSAQGVESKGDYTNGTAYIEGQEGTMGAGKA
uniref:Uncharacterized protein n=1 Tax=Odontella aurita TaxID=265563 RepID=A0A7S4IF63_9STRA|mmetsp:Transcript_2426/g.6374  ORF Transcript_2426/g.6374 Transcript_2426/m.6374 type:complete len:158 (+) Transcript_2426:301-774(+)